MEHSLELDKRLSENISRVTEEDKIIFEQYLNKAKTAKPRINYEDSFEYIRMYFNLGKFHGYRYFDKETLIFFAVSGSAKKPHFKIFKPLGQDLETSTKFFIKFIQALKHSTPNPILLTCLSNAHLKNIKAQVNIKKVKSFEYYIYDLEALSDLNGNKWRNVRQKLNTFQKNHPKVKSTPLTTENSKKVLHFISAWRTDTAATRGFSYVDIDKNKAAVRYYQNKIDFEDLWAKVYYIHGNVEAFQLLYRILTPAAHERYCAHAIGMANNRIPGLSEYSQIDIWHVLRDKGIKYVNDGPSWRPGLKRYKRKFNPCGTQQVYECTV